MNDGWIKLYRSFLDWEWYRDNNTKAVFLHLLLTANHEAQRWMGKVIERGQVVTGRMALAESLGLTERQIRTVLSKLEKTGEICKESTNKYTIITICNFDKYQSKEQNESPTNVQQMSNKCPTNDHKQECEELKNNNYDDDASEPQILSQEELALAQQIKNESDFNALPLEDKQRKLREYAELTLSNPQQVEYLAANVLHDKDWGKVQDYVLLHRDTMMFEGKFFPSEKAYTNHLRRWKGSYDFMKQNKNYRQNGNKGDQYARRRGTAPSPLEEFINDEGF